MKAEIMIHVYEDSGRQLHSEGYECDVGHLEQLRLTLRNSVKGRLVTWDLLDVLTRTLNETTPVRESQGDDE